MFKGQLISRKLKGEVHKKGADEEGIYREIME